MLLDPGWTASSLLLSSLKHGLLRSYADHYLASQLDRDASLADFSYVNRIGVPSEAG